MQETQLAKDNSVRSKIVYDYDRPGIRLATRFMMARASCSDEPVQKAGTPSGAAPAIGQPSALAYGISRREFFVHSLGQNLAAPLARTGKESYQVSA